MPSGKDRIQRFLRKSPEQSYSIKEIASKLKLDYNTTKNYCSELAKGNLIIRESNGIYRGIVNIIQNLIDWVKNEVKDNDFRDLIIRIATNNFPLGIHYLNCEFQSKTINYSKIQWNISNVQSKAKSFRLSSLDPIGKTEITVWRNNKVRVVYNGENKKFLTENNYIIWFQSVNTFLQSYPDIELKEDLEKFRITQIEFNTDIRLQEKKDRTLIPSPRNLRISHLNYIVEIYQFEDNKGKKRLRLGLRKAMEEEKSMSGNFLDLLFHGTTQSNAINTTINKVANLEKDVNDTKIKMDTLLQKQQETTNDLEIDFKKRLSHMEIESEKKQKKLLKEIKLLDKKTEKINKFNKKDLLNIQNFLSTEIDSTSKSVVDFKNIYDKDYNIVSVKVENQNKLLQELINNLQIEITERKSETSEAKNQTKAIIDLIKTFKDENDKVIQTLSDDFQDLHKDVIDLINKTSTDQSKINGDLKDIVNRLVNIEEERRKKKRFLFFKRK